MVTIATMEITGEMVKVTRQVPITGLYIDYSAVSMAGDMFTKFKKTKEIAKT